MGLGSSKEYIDEGQIIAVVAKKQRGKEASSSHIKTKTYV